MKKTKAVVAVRWALTVVMAVTLPWAAGCQESGPTAVAPVSAHTQLGNSGRAGAAGQQPAWARELDENGLPNLHQVSANLYRGAQPTPAGFRRLKELGIKTVVNLRSNGDEGEDLGSTGLRYESIESKAFTMGDDEAARFLKIVSDPQNQPVFVHCRRGADRTGVVCALYRVAVQDWSRAQAVDEMTHGGYGFNSLFFQRLVRYIYDVDVAGLKRQAGVKTVAVN